MKNKYNNVTIGVNDLYTLEPKLAKELSPKSGIDPKQINRYNPYPALWRCPNCEYDYYYSVLRRKLNDNVCPQCTNRILIEGKNDLKTTHPLLCTEWSEKNVIKPKEVTKNMIRSIIWNCSNCGEEFFYDLNKREFNDNVCPSCNGYRVEKGINDLETTSEFLANEVSPKNKLKPYEMHRCWPMNIIWECNTCKTEYTYPIHTRTEDNEQCPVCSGTVLVEGTNDLQTVDPMLAKEYSVNNVLPPNKIARKAIALVNWICPICKGEYRYYLRGRILNDKKCPYCNEEKVKAGFNTFKVKHNTLMKEYLKIENLLLEVNPDNELDKSNVNAYWQCKECKYKYLMTFKDKTKNEKRNFISCPRCRGRRQIRFYHIKI